jgi:hypothetical protein
MKMDWWRVSKHEEYVKKVDKLGKEWRKGEKKIEK